MGKWALLHYPEPREVADAIGAGVRRLLARKPVYLLHDQVVFALKMKTEDRAGGVRGRFLLLETIAAIGEAGQRDLEKLRLGGPLQSDALRLLAYEDAEATEQVDGLLTERAAEAFLDKVHDQLHK